MKKPESMRSINKRRDMHVRKVYRELIRLERHWGHDGVRRAIAKWIRKPLRGKYLGKFE
jgi:hypothetical protein